MNRNKNYYAILMAGGIGSRFWPVSTEQFPKQFHDMLGAGQTLIQKTFGRLSGFIPPENILILTNEKYEGLVKEQIPGINDEQIILEPAMRNTAPCILYASMKIKKQNEDALIIVAPSDHWIENEEAFENDVLTCFNYCKDHDALMTLGITPTFPNTGYGYIEYEKGENSIKKVRQFREKPDYETARMFIDQGNFLWNGGIFIWSATSALKAFEKHNQSLYNLFQDGYNSYNTPEEVKFIDTNYSKAENISVDYAIMEDSQNVYVLPASFDWNDLGTWGSLFDKLESDENDNVIINARNLSINSSNNLIRTEDRKLVVIDGLRDYIVVDNEEVLLVFPRENEQHIKKTLELVKSKFGSDYS